MAGLFVVQGGADLALTQVAIETLSTVLFVLVLRRLPDRFESRAAGAGRAVRARRVAAAVGVTVFVLRPHRRRATAPPSPCRTRWSSGRCPTAAAATSST